jgi:hypothetical protein
MPDVCGTPPGLWQAPVCGISSRWEETGATLSFPFRRAPSPIFGAPIFSEAQKSPDLSVGQRHLDGALFLETVVLSDTGGTVLRVAVIFCRAGR